ncbi:MAG: hypothetical protein RL681_7 [Candidatus Parcubacteria bacterium]|jgi:ribosome recycling factor
MDIYSKELDSALRAVLERFVNELQGVRSNRPNPQLVEDLPVVAYNQTMTVKQMGSITIRPPRDILVALWDASVINTVAKAIQDGRPGLSVANDGNSIRVTLPALTDERREEFARLAKKMAETARIQIRTHRDEVMKKMKAAQDRKELTEDAAFKAKEAAQKVVEGVNAKVESQLASKLAELVE